MKNRSINSIRNKNPKNTTIPAKAIASNIFKSIFFISKNAPQLEVLQPQQNLTHCYKPSAFCSIHFGTLLPQDL